MWKTILLMRVLNIVCQKQGMIGLTAILRLLRAAKRYILRLVHRLTETGTLTSRILTMIPIQIGIEEGSIPGALQSTTLVTRRDRVIRPVLAVHLRKMCGQQITQSMSAGQGLQITWVSSDTITNGQQVHLLPCPRVIRTPIPRAALGRRRVFLAQMGHGTSIFFIWTPLIIWPVRLPITDRSR